MRRPAGEIDPNGGSALRKTEETGENLVAKGYSSEYKEGDFFTEVTGWWA